MNVDLQDADGLSASAKRREHEDIIVIDPRTDVPPPDQWPQALIARRVAGSGTPLPDATLALLQKLPALLQTEPFCWQLGDTNRARRVELDLPRIATAINRPGGLAVVDRPTHWTTMVQVAKTPHQRRESFELSLPGPREHQLLDLDGMMALSHACAVALGAHVVYTLHLALHVTYHGRRQIERTEQNLATLPPKIRAGIPKQTFEPVPHIVPGLPDLLEAIDFEETLVPDGVYWLNWWNAKMIDTLGRERVEGAGWAQIARHADGSMTLAATEAPPDLTSADDVGQLVRILEALDLRAQQERHPPGGTVSEAPRDL
ncbi:MAG TPA: hypothetical protein VNO30_22260 [Kofleriaceae bacterium]|nr:hypothetical protein [Kofleriaceae bacterium]